MLLFFAPAHKLKNNHSPYYKYRSNKRKDEQIAEVN